MVEEFLAGKTMNKDPGARNSMVCWELKEGKLCWEAKDDGRWG
jgi:hypothetical protein